MYTLMRFVSLYVWVEFLVHLYGVVGCLSMIVWTHAVLGVLYAHVLYFCICTCSAQLNIFCMEIRCRNTIYYYYYYCCCCRRHYYYHHHFYCMVTYATVTSRVLRPVV